MTEAYELLCRKLSLTVKEFGHDAVKNSVMVGPSDYDHVSDVKYITVSTMGCEKLGLCSYKMARFFEDCE